MRRIDTKDITDLSVGFGRMTHNLPAQDVNKILRKVSRPLLARLQKETPVSRQGEHIPLSRKGRSANAYRRGGATRRDLRIKSAKGRGSEIGRVIVGVSKKMGKVGWRTGFIAGGTKPRYTKKGAYRGRMTKNDFLTRSYDVEIGGIREGFSRDFKTLFESWAKQNLPQR